MFMKSSSKIFHFEKKSLVKIYHLIAIVIAVVIFSSCQKEVVSNPGNSLTSDVLQSSSITDTTLKVDAGPARRFVYPLSTSIRLFGKGSSRQGPVTFQWMQVSGNSTSTIVSPHDDTTVISGLNPGIYTFALTVTNKNGVTKRDTTSISVLQKMTWTIEGITREALVHFSSGSGPAPVIFAFHGHAGSALGFSDKGFELQWPEAIVVYPQGLPTKSHEDRYGRNTGWQHQVGEINSHTNIKDQDLKFFDAMLSTYENNYNINSNQIFVHGWSNGGEFVYNVLWTAREDKLAALAPAAATLGTTTGKKTVPLIHIAGTSDPFVNFSSQQQTVKAVRTLDECSPAGTTWMIGVNGLLGTHYSSYINRPVVFLQYDGGHNYPSTVTPSIINFFKQVSTTNL